MNSKYCELNRPHSTDCRICDIFISLIYSYTHRKKKKNPPWKGGVRCLVGYLWVFWLFFFCNVGDRGRVGMLLFKKKDIICTLILFFLQV